MAIAAALVLAQAGDILKIWVLLRQLGIDFDEDLARAHPYHGDRLHLEMQEAPCNYRRPNRFEGGAPSSPED